MVTVCLGIIHIYFLQKVRTFNGEQYINSLYPVEQKFEEKRPRHQTKKYALSPRYYKVAKLVTNCLLVWHISQIWTPVTISCFLTWTNGSAERNWAQIFFGDLDKRHLEESKIWKKSVWSSKERTLFVVKYLFHSKIHLLIINPDDPTQQETRAVYYKRELDTLFV